MSCLWLFFFLQDMRSRANSLFTSYPSTCFLCQLFFYLTINLKIVSVSNYVILWKFSSQVESAIYYSTDLCHIGLVTDLKGHFVTQVAMGKAHTCVLMKNGEVWTFGVNNKGQCGRDTGSMSQGGKGKEPRIFLLFYALKNITSKNITYFI